MFRHVPDGATPELARPLMLEALDSVNQLLLLPASYRNWEPDLVFPTRTFAVEEVIKIA